MPGGVAAALPQEEGSRLAALRALEILDTPPDQEFDAIVKLAAEICGVPIALVSLVDESRQWFKASIGLEVKETARDVAYCAHAILADEMLVVPDAALDPRFVDNPLRTGPPHAEFYAGVPLRTPSGHNVGTLCVIDQVPRSLSAAQKAALESLAAQVVRLLELRRTAILQSQALTVLHENEAALRRGLSLVPTARAPEWSRAALTLGILIALCTVLASAWVKRAIDEVGTERLTQGASRAERFLAQRATAYGEVVRGTAALFRASDAVSGSEFRRFVDTLDVARNYPGLLGIGYAEVVPRANLSVWEAAVRAEIEGFRVVTRGDHASLVVNRLLEPLASNRAALGFDQRSDPARNGAIDAAARSGDLAMSRRVTLRQDPNGGPGFMFYLAISDPELARVSGFAFGVARGRDLVKGVEQAAGANIDLTLRDSLQDLPLLGTASSPTAQAVTLDVAIADRKLRIVAKPGEGFYTDSERVQPWLVLGLGLLLAGLVFALTTSMRHTEARSRTLAAQMTEVLRRAERELRAVVDGTTDLILTFSEDGRILLANQALKQLLSVDQDGARSLTLSDVLAPNTQAAFEQAVRAEQAGTGPRHVQTQFCTRRGDVIDVEGAVSTRAEDGKRVTRGIFRDVTARKQAERALVATNQALEHLAKTDGLTGVANRRAFQEHLRSEISRARRSGTPLALILFDVDHFKAYNDAYGHPSGDECLRKVAEVLMSYARRTGELAARYGGEEFALILPGAKLELAEQTAERLRASIEALGIGHAGHPLGVVTVSLGVAAFEVSMAEPETLLGAADEALYLAKRQGRNRVACYASAAATGSE